MKKLYAILLSAIMCISLLPASVWAGEDTDGMTQQELYDKCGYQETKGTGIGISKEDVANENGTKQGKGRLPNLKSKDSNITLRYGRNYIKTIDNCDKYLWAYDKIAAGVEAMETEISLYEEDRYEIVIGEFLWIYEAVRNDYPEYFWWGNSYKYRYYENNNVFEKDQIMVDFTPEYLWAKSSAAFYRAKADFENSAAEIIDGLTGETDFEKEVEIHDWLVRNNRYQDDVGNEHNAYGALVEGEIVCEGYARAFQFLLNKAGIECCIVSGMGGSNAGDENVVNHAWNAVKIDGDWYQTDVTWDDLDLSETGFNETPEEMSYCYFNLTTDEISDSHTIVEEGAPAPECSATEYFYYNYNSDLRACVGEDDDNDIANRIAGQIKHNGFARIYVTNDNPDALGDWWFLESEEASNHGRVADKLHILDGYSYGYNRIGDREYNIKLSMEEGGKEYRAQASGWIIQPDSEGNVTVRFYEAWVPDIETKVTKSVSTGDTDVYVLDSAFSKWEYDAGTGMYKASFTFDDIPCGEYQVAVYKPGYPVVTGTLYLGTDGITADESISENINVWDIVRLGDIDRNGTVDFADVLYLKRHLADWEGYEQAGMSCADVNHDGEINHKDLIILEKHLAGYSGYESLEN